MLPGLDSILKFIRCTCKMGTDAAYKKRSSCQKNGSWEKEEGCSNKSKSSIIDDIHGDNDCDAFDTFASFW